MREQPHRHHPCCTLLRKGGGTRTDSGLPPVPSAGPRWPAARAMASQANAGGKGVCPRYEFHAKFPGLSKIHSVSDIRGDATGLPRGHREKNGRQKELQASSPSITSFGGKNEKKNDHLLRPGVACRSVAFPAAAQNVKITPAGLARRRAVRRAIARRSSRTRRGRAHPVRRRSIGDGRRRPSTGHRCMSSLLEPTRTATTSATRKFEGPGRRGPCENPETGLRPRPNSTNGRDRRRQRMRPSSWKRADWLPFIGKKIDNIKGKPDRQTVPASRGGPRGGRFAAAPCLATRAHRRHAARQDRQCVARASVEITAVTAAATNSTVAAQPADPKPGAQGAGGRQRQRDARAVDRLCHQVSPTASPSTCPATPGCNAEMKIGGQRNYHKGEISCC